MDAPIDEAQPKYVTLADRFEEKAFINLNDLTVHSSGSIFFTDPPYGLPKPLDGSARELDFQGVCRVDPDGRVTLLAASNGITLSPDEKTVYVAQSHKTAQLCMAYRLDDQLNIDAGRVLFDANELGETRKGNPDGQKSGSARESVRHCPGGVLVLSPEGKHLGTLRTGELIANCAFGDDGRTLYMTSDSYLCRVRLSTTGKGF